MRNRSRRVREHGFTMSDVVFADLTGKEPEGSVRWQVCKTSGVETSL